MTVDPLTTELRIGGPDDLNAVALVERDADRRFADAGVDIGDTTDPEPVASLVEAAQAGRLAVAVEATTVVGFAWWSVVDGDAHLEQVSVLVDQAGKGIGRQLIDWVASMAADAGHAALTLTTFADVAWNGPLYLKYGFVTLAPDELGPELAERRRHEGEIGLDVLPRVAMRRTLTPTPDS